MARIQQELDPDGKSVFNSDSQAESQVDISPDTLTDRPEWQVSKEKITIDCNNLLIALAASVSTLPSGNFIFLKDHQSSSLIPLECEMSNLPMGAMGIQKHDGHITIAHPYVLESGRSFSNTSLEMKIDGAGQLLSATFQLSDHKCSIEIRIKQLDEGLRSSAWVHLPLIKQVSSLNPMYTGDKKVLSFSSLGSYEPGQLALLLQDGQVPDIDFQLVISRWLLEGHLEASSAVTLPQLTFSPDEYEFNPFHSRVYPVEKDGVISSLEAGSVVSGVAITEQKERPYRIDVKIDSIHEVDFEYADGIGKATKISGQITLDDGMGNVRTETKTFTVLSDIVYLKKNLRLIPSGAFATFSIGD